MARRFWIAFYVLNLMVYGLGTLVLAVAGVASLVNHRGGQWKDLRLGARWCISMPHRVASAAPGDPQRLTANRGGLGRHLDVGMAVIGWGWVLFPTHRVCDTWKTRQTLFFDAVMRAAVFLVL